MHAASVRTYASVEILDLMSDPDRWDGERVRTRGFARLVDYGSEPALELFGASATTAVEQSQPRCSVAEQPILVPLSEEASRQVRELQNRKGPPRFVEIEGLFSTSGTRLYTGHVFTEYSRAILGARVPKIETDVCLF
jgi:hypothetical protein